MMDKLISLLKTDLNITFGLSSLKYDLKNRKDKWKIGLVILFIVSVVPAYGIFIKFLLNLYEGYKIVGIERAFILSGFLITQILIFLFGIIFVMSKYYFSNDLNILLPLPLKAGTIVGAKFLSMVVNEYIVSFPIIIPYMVIYGLKSQVNFIYWIYALFLILLLPFIPLALDSVIVMFFMRWTNIKGKKDFMRIIGYVLMMVLILFFQFKLQNMGNDLLAQGNTDAIMKYIDQKNDLIRNLGMSFPPSSWATLALTESNKILGFVYLIVFGGASVGGFLLVSALSEKLFFKGLMGNFEEKGRGSNVTEEEIKKGFSKIRPQYMAVFSKEMKTLVRTPIYLFNSIGGVIIVPIILVMTTAMDNGNSLKVLTVYAQKFPHYITLFGTGLIVFLGIANSVGATTFSREGKNFWIIRSAPSKYSDQIIGRLLSSLMVQAIGIVCLIVVLPFLIKIDLENIIGIIALGMLGSIPVTLLGMIVDILRPLLDWDNPQKAMKENLNVLIGMGIGALYILIVGLLVYLLLKIDVNIYLIYLSMGLIFCLSSYFLFKILTKLVERQFINLE